MGRTRIVQVVTGLSRRVFVKEVSYMTRLFLNSLSCYSLSFNGLCGSKQVNLSMIRHDTFIKLVTQVENMSTGL